jgi:hypothetical protein
VIRPKKKKGVEESRHSRSNSLHSQPNPLISPSLARSKKHSTGAFITPNHLHATEREEQDPAPMPGQQVALPHYAFCPITDTHGDGKKIVDGESQQEDERGDSPTNVMDVPNQQPVPSSKISCAFLSEVAASEEDNDYDNDPQQSNIQSNNAANSSSVQSSDNSSDKTVVLQSLRLAMEAAPSSGSPHDNLAHDQLTIVSNQHISNPPENAEKILAMAQAYKLGQQIATENYVRRINQALLNKGVTYQVIMAKQDEIRFRAECRVTGSSFVTESCLQNDADSIIASSDD